MRPASGRPPARGRVRGAVGLAVAAVLLLSACGGDDAVVAGPTVGNTEGPQTLRVTSPVFTGDGRIPVAYTCDGDGIVPVLQWSALPQGTRAVAVVVDDPDAPNGTFTHLLAVLVGEPTGTTGMDFEGEAIMAQNSRGDASWTPPCPPEGDGPHHYVFTVTALAELPTIDDGTALDQARLALEEVDHLAQGSVTATYAR